MRAPGSRLPLDGDELGAVADSLFSEEAPAPGRTPEPAEPATGRAPEPAEPAPGRTPEPAEPAAPAGRAAAARRLPISPVARARERGSDWLLLSGGALLLISLFLTWSHQLSAELRRALAGTVALQGVVADPDAWQVYSVAGVLLATLALVMTGLALRGRRGARLLCAPFVMLALAFVAHALGHPPTDGTNLVAGALTPVRYAPNPVSSGAGEPVALAALGMALLGIAATPVEPV